MFSKCAIGEIENQNSAFALEGDDTNSNSYDTFVDKNSSKLNLISSSWKIDDNEDSKLNNKEEDNEDSDILPNLWSLHHLYDSGKESSECSRVMPQEDLDHLEPGWELNDGFEWAQPQDNDVSFIIFGFCEI